MIRPAQPTDEEGLRWLEDEARADVATRRGGPQLLAERPAIKGISLPGMPDGSPGMGGRKKEPFQIYEITDGSTRIYAVE